ncbi:CADM3 [Mytilus coruscus]|uniref:CADM3 n=1 Tax=Mytilus coruscus TaxID=42192 RepID=A0A6J8EQJ4_MYTCO|nr:CADM3 [Mytilus coruscus]
MQSDISNRSTLFPTKNVTGKELSTLPSTTTKWEKERFPREGDNVTFVCSGNVGRPPGNIVWQKMFTQSNRSLNDVNATTQKEAVTWKCSFNGTSYLTFQLSAKDYKAKIRCFVVSQDGIPGLYVETKPLDIHFHVRHVSINKLPDKQTYDPTVKNITLTCNSEGNPKPTYAWYKESDTNTTLSTSKLYLINNVRKNKSGTYICEVHNSIGDEKYNASSSVDIHIENRSDDEKNILESPYTITILVGVLTLLCVICVISTYLCICKGICFKPSEGNGKLVAISSVSNTVDVSNDNQGCISMSMSNVNYTDSRNAINTDNASQGLENKRNENSTCQTNNQNSDQHMDINDERLGDHSEKECGHDSSIHEPNNSENNKTDKPGYDQSAEFDKAVDRTQENELNGTGSNGDKITMGQRKDGEDKTETLREIESPRKSLDAPKTNSSRVKVILENIQDSADIDGDTNKISGNLLDS